MILPLPGPAGLRYCRWLRWVHVGQRTPWGRFVQVFTSLDLGADGQPHYAGGGGVWQAQQTTDRIIR